MVWETYRSKVEKTNESLRGKPAYYLSNNVIESDYSLQNHSGGPETPQHTKGAPSDFATNFPPPQPLPNQPLPTQYQNVYALDKAGNFVARYNMGGCTGCHGLASVRAGTDYSYILFNSSVKQPEAPDTDELTLRKRYIGSLK